MNRAAACLALGLLLAPFPVIAQTPPDAAEIAAYRGLFAAAATGNNAEIARELDGGADPNQRDGHGRTPLLVAGHGGHLGVAELLLRRGADPRAMDMRRYDLITIAAVRDDVPMLRLAIAGGGDPRAVTSPYDGTALIAAAHLGHVEPVRILIEADAPLDHVNNLDWTALLEAVILGNGGPNYVKIVKLLLTAGADPNRVDGQGDTPLKIARSLGRHALADAIEAAGGR